MKKVMLAVTVLALCSASFAGSPNVSNANASSSAQATSTCAFTFTSGVNNTFLQYCVTANGNIAQLATPFAREHIAVGTIGEGYAICDVTTSVGYFDYADFGDSGNWEPAKVVSKEDSSIRIVRSTSDGVWTLTQTITQLAASQAVRVTMALKNNTNTSRLAALMRYADVDVSGTSDNNFDATLTSAFGWNSFGAPNPPFGLMVQNVGNPVGLSAIPFIQNQGAGPTPCVPGSHAVFGPITGTDGSIVMSYEGTIPRNRTRTASMNYKGL